MAKKIIQPNSAHPDSANDIPGHETIPNPIDLIESMHELVTQACETPSSISFMDSLALCSLSNTLGYIRASVSIDPLDYRTRFFVSEIEAYADSIALRLSEARNPLGRINYEYPINFPACAISQYDGYAPDDASYRWIDDSLLRMETEGMLPDDIDSTWSALYGLARHMRPDQTMPPALIASCIKNLESVRKPGAPHAFNTWFTDGDHSDNDDHGIEYKDWESEDIVASSSVVAFFDVMDPAILTESRSFIFDRLMAFIRNPSKSAWFSEFYHSMPLVAYMMARMTWLPEQRTALISSMTDMLECHDQETDNLRSACPRIAIQNATDASLYVASLVRLAEQIHAHGGDATYPELDVPKLRRIMGSFSQGDQACFVAPDPLYVHSLQNDKTTYAASPIVSSLIMFESEFALIHISENEKKAEQPPEHEATRDGRTATCSAACYATLIPSPYGGRRMHLTERTMQNIREFEVLKDMQDMTDRLFSGTDFSICLDMCMALLPHDTASAEDALTAHALGLCAYFLYDKIYDREISPTMLPVLFLTNSVFQGYIQQIASELVDRDIDIPDDVRTILADTDISYYVLSTRGDDVSLCIHSKKSMGAALVPLLCMLKAEMSAHATKCVFDFFEHFNLARQISDDAKDAAEDGAAPVPKQTTMKCFESQRQIECAIFREIRAARRALDSLLNVPNAPHAKDKAGYGANQDHLRSVRDILQKRLDEFLIKALHAKWELSVLGSL